MEKSEYKVILEQYVEQIEHQLMPLRSWILLLWC